jgi:hypothetical protein
MTADAFSGRAAQNRKRSGASERPTARNHRREGQLSRR